MSGAIKPPEWTLLAACAQVGTELFFPEKGGTTKPAKSVCGRCDARDDCLDYALRQGEMFGIWGGKSERERRKIARTLGIRKTCTRCRTNPVAIDSERVFLCVDCQVVAREEALYRCRNEVAS